MELREFMSVRRAYNLVRQQAESSSRLTFEEFAILCRLDIVDKEVKTSEIAEYQGALRPTMTHRTSHLASLGYIDRVEGKEDRRNIVCMISEEGRAYVRSLCELTRGKIPGGQPLARTSSDRIRKYVDAMGTVYCTAGELVLLALNLQDERGCSITQLVDALGFLQPTVSMSVSALGEDGLVSRNHLKGMPTRSAYIKLTPEGTAQAQALSSKISSIVVRRRLRS